MRRIVLGDDQEAGRVFVEAVNDPGPFDAADPGQAFSAMGNQRVDQGTGLVSGRRMDHETRRLVDDEQVVVFVDDR